MILRKAINAIKGYKYIVDEYTPNKSTLQYEKRTIEIRLADTKVRRLDYNLHHEREIKPGYFVSMTETEFNESKKRKFTLADFGIKKVSKGPKIKLASRMIFTDHFKERVYQRFDVSEGTLFGFIQKILMDHFIVENYEFYNGTYREHQPNDLAICSRDFKKIVIARVEKDKFILITCFNPLDGGYTSFLNWFRIICTKSICSRHYRITWRIYDSQRM
jgi:hypothetical protein